MSKDIKQINAKSQDDPDTIALRAIKEAITLLKYANNAVEHYKAYMQITKAFRFAPESFPDTNKITDLIQESIKRSQKQMDMLHWVGYYAKSYYAKSKDNDGETD